MTALATALAAIRRHAGDLAAAEFELVVLEKGLSDAEFGVHVSSEQGRSEMGLGAVWVIYRLSFGRPSGYLDWFDNGWRQTT